MSKFKIKLTQVKTEVRFVEVEADSNAEAEELVALGISNVGFSEIGEQSELDYETRVNGKYMNDDATLDEESVFE